MRKTALSIVTVMLIAIVGLPAMAADAGTAQSTSCCKAEWTPLFNGKDLTGWQNARNPEAENCWGVEDGALTNLKTGHDGNDISTTESFKDFCLKLEYKTVPKGNSGVYLRGRVEVQVLDSFGKNPPGKGDDGAIYDQFAPRENASKPAGEWNTLEATYRGDTVTVTLNGKVVQDKVKITSVTGGALPGGVDEPGPLMLQGNHGKVWYRNIMIRPCPAEGACPAEKK